MKSKIHEYQINNSKIISKNLLFLIIILFTTLAFSQEIEIKGGRYFVDGQQISSRETREKLASNPQALSLFKKGKAKESNGTLLLGLGVAFTVGDLVKGLVSDEDYPGVGTYIGAGLIAVSIPILSGKNKKMRQGIELYNNGLKNTGFNSNIEFSAISNQNGYGFQIRF